MSDLIPERWKHVVVARAAGYNNKEIAQMMGTNPATLSATSKDLESARDSYESPTDFVEEVLGQELDVDADLDPSKLEEANEDDEQ